MCSRCSHDIAADALTFPLRLIIYVNVLENRKAPEHAANKILRRVFRLFINGFFAYWNRGQFMQPSPRRSG